MKKKAIIDLGSLKAKVSVFDSEKKQLLSSMSYLTLLGKGIDEDRVINAESLQMLDDSLVEISKYLNDQGVLTMEIIGTEALRKAENIDTVFNIIEKHFPGKKLEVVNQQMEADLFFRAVSKEFPDKKIVAADIGGGSVQIISGYYDTETAKAVIEEKHNLKTGTYRLQQQYSPNNSIISNQLDVAFDKIFEAYQEVCVHAPIFVFGSTCMQDFIVSSGTVYHNDSESTSHSVFVTREDLAGLLDKIKKLAPDKRDQFYPDGGYFIYGADYLLMNVLVAVDKVQPERIYPTNINSSYAFI